MPILLLLLSAAARSAWDPASTLTGETPPRRDRADTRGRIAGGPFRVKDYDNASANRREGGLGRELSIIEQGEEDSGFASDLFDGGAVVHDVVAMAGVDLGRLLGRGAPKDVDVFHLKT